ncbi:MAG: acyl-[acyl-carrier-protein] thioesterase [Lachnospiraceae bacterium]
MYSFESRVRYSEVDENGLLSIIGIMNYLQDCSTFQSEHIGRGIRWLQEHDRAWLVTGWKISILRRPELTEKIRLSTRPYQYRGILGLRYFDIRSADTNELLVGADSAWCYTQPSTGKPVRITPEDIDPYLPVDEMPEGCGMKNRKIAVPDSGTPLAPFVIQRTHLDTNHHVNNAQYVEMARDCLPEGFSYSGIQVQYLAQAHLGDTVVPVLYREENRMTVSLGDGSGTVYAIVAFSER